MATDRLLECLCDAAETYEICVIGEEPGHAYNRIMLSSVLAGEKSASEIQLKDTAWYNSKQIQLLSGDRVNTIDRQTRKVTLNSGRQLAYDTLVLATGARASIPPIEGIHHPAVRCFRNLEDVDFLLHRAKSIDSVLIVGGGLLGLEAAHGMNLAGVAVHLVHRRAHLMNRQLDSRAGQILQAQLEARGMHFYMKSNPLSIADRSGRAELQLDSGLKLSADLIIFAAGIQPNKELAETCGITCDRAILVNDQMQTSDNRIFAIGECAEHQSRTIGLVAPAKRQAEVLAANLLGQKQAYSHREDSTHLKVSGIEMFSAGQIEQSTDTESLMLEDPEFGIYRNLILKKNQLCGAILLGDKSSSSWYEQLIGEGRDLSALKTKLIFGRDFCSAEERTTVVKEVV